MDMVKAGIVGVVGVLLAVSLKSHKAEYGVYVALAVCFVMLEYIMRYFMQILSGMEALRGGTGGDAWQALHSLHGDAGAAFPDGEHTIDGNVKREKYF